MNILKRKAIAITAAIIGALFTLSGIALAVIHAACHLLGIDHPF